MTDLPLYKKFNNVIAEIEDAIASEFTHYHTGIYYELGNGEVYASSMRNDYHYQGIVEDRVFDLREFIYLFQLEIYLVEILMLDAAGYTAEFDN
jgi:hypothetical protein